MSGGSGFRTRWSGWLALGVFVLGVSGICVFGLCVLGFGGLAFLAVAEPPRAEPPESATSSGDEAKASAFERVRRHRAVVVTKEYDVSGLMLPIEEIHELLPRDAIASLTNPVLEDAVRANWLKPEDRVLDVTIGNESVAVPFRILEFHEIANLVVGGKPVAATY